MANEDTIGIGDYDYPHLSLCILESFFENDTDNKVSVKPIIERYCDQIGLRFDEEYRNDEKFSEHKVSDLLRNIEEFDANKREAIFVQKNLSSLTILLELFIKNKFETIDDVLKVRDNQEKINDFRKKLEAKGYIRKFNDAIMQSIFGKDVEMKRKKDDKQVGVMAPTINVMPEIIQTSTRKIQLFPSIYGAVKWGILTSISFAVMLWSAIMANVYFSQYNSLTALNCFQQEQPQVNAMTGQQTASALTGTMKAICDGNGGATGFGYIFFSLAVIALGLAIFGAVKLFKIVLHNQFANAHNTFELTHFTLTNKK